jgi:hypothetical protein
LHDFVSIEGNARNRDSSGICCRIPAPNRQSRRETYDGPIHFSGTALDAQAFSPQEQKEARMRKLAFSAVAAAALLVTAVPAMAQVGFYVGPGGFSVGVGPPYYGPGYYDYYGGPDWYWWHGRRYHRWHRW